MKKTDHCQIHTIGTRADLHPEDFEYDYNPDLTKELDDFADDFDQNIVNKITLWKVNRYPYLDEDILRRLNSISNDKYLNEGHRELLLILLRCKGFQLPMASTLLRFRNPKLFQIIDQHVYRLLTGKELNLPLYDSDKNRNKLCELYFDYLTELKAKCLALEIPFEISDRILYKADKRLNKGIKLKNYGGE